MGIETALALAVVGTTVKGVMSAKAAREQARSESDALIAEGNIQAANRAKETALKAAAQRVSFLSSGFTLEGTPMNVIEDTINTGFQDVKQIEKNYNTQARNVLRAGRAKAQEAMLSSITSIASPFAGSFAYGSSASGSTQSIKPVLTPDATAGQTLPWRNL